ncbi:MAG TPA: hypothetical protein VMW62_06910 [Chloroflexota bacterium]|nr:hypothetical protein [Chloroflexota bacterium]
MGALLALLATTAAVVFTAWPLVRRGQQGGTDSAELSELVSQRDLAIEDIRELDFDHDLGNLSEEDHQELREQSKRRAVAILKQIQAQDGRIDEEIEQAIAALRGSAPAS